MSRRKLPLCERPCTKHGSPCIYPAFHESMVETHDCRECVDETEMKK